MEEGAREAVLWPSRLLDLSSETRHRFCPSVSRNTSWLLEQISSFSPLSWFLLHKPLWHLDSLAHGSGAAGIRVSVRLPDHANRLGARLLSCLPTQPSVGGVCVSEAALGQEGRASRNLTLQGTPNLRGDPQAYFWSCLPLRDLS